LVFSPARVGRREAETPLIPDFNQEQRRQVGEIRINSDEGKLQLVKKGDAWVLPGGDPEYPASEAKISGFFDFLADLKRTRVVTDNPETWAEFELGREALKRIQLLDRSGAKIVEIIVGKPAIGGGDDYVRLADSNEIVQLSSSFSYYLNVEEKFWSHLRIFPEELDGQTLMRITVQSTVVFSDGTPGPLNYTLVLNPQPPNLWQFLDRPETTLDAEMIDQLAGSLADLEGAEFARSVTTEEAGLTTPSARILFSTMDGRDFQLLIGGTAGENQFYVAREQGGYIYQVSEWRMKRILINQEELVAEQ
jgi:hypothetical protein